MVRIARAQVIFAAVAVLLFAASVAGSALRYTSMSAMSGTPMPGGWTLSAAWLPLCGRTWLQTAVSFVSMWATMMPAMMLPALAPMLWRECESSILQSGLLIISTASGYFLAWLLAGIVLFPLGAAFAALALRMPALARAAPLAAGVVVSGAGILQCTTWKAKRLACCRLVRARVRACHHASPVSAVEGICEGMRLAVVCGLCCSNWMAVLLATGVMDRHATLIVSAAIAVERIAAAQKPLVRLAGVASIAAGGMLIARAI
jgi:predicted metal-binding membrane protein